MGPTHRSWFFPPHTKNKKVVAGLWPKPWRCEGKPTLFVAMELLACPWPGINAQDHPSDRSPVLCSMCSSLTEIKYFKKNSISISASSKQKNDGVKVTGLQSGATGCGHPWMSQTSLPESPRCHPLSTFGNGRGETNQPSRMRKPMG